MKKIKNNKIITIGLIIIVAFILTNCNNSEFPSDSFNSEQSYQETKMTLEEEESKNPTSFLEVNATYSKNLIGEWVISGTISNSATIVTYKDVVLIIEFVSKTESLLGTEKHVIYDYFPSSKTKKFKIKTYGKKKTKTIGLYIDDASNDY